MADEKIPETTEELFDYETSRPEEALYPKVQEFLNDIHKEGKIEDFANKVSHAGFLRMAMISHIHTLISIPKSEAANQIDRWLDHILGKKHAFCRPEEVNPIDADNPNNNCLEGIACPSCNSFGPFDIAVRMVQRVHDDGTEEPHGGPFTYEGPEWDGNSACFCVACEYSGSVKDFDDRYIESLKAEIERDRLKLKNRRPVPKKGLKRFIVPVTWTQSGNYEVDAETAEDALSIAEDIDQLPMGTFVEGSFSIDHEIFWNDPEGNPQ